MRQEPTVPRLWVLPRFLAVVLSTAWALAGPSMPTAAAATFTVEPTQIFFAGRTNSVLVTLRNESTENLRFELSAFAWSQSPTGEMQLEPTEDIVFFPSLLTLAPGESRKVRVGSATSLEAREKTYRIFVEELPPLERSTNGIRVLTRMGIPIFLRPAKELASATVSGLGLQGRTLRFTVANDGSVHFVPKDIRVRGLAGSSTAFEQELEGWYVLAGGRRDFELALPDADCAQITSLLVDVQLGTESLQERLQTPNGVCVR